MQKHLGHPAEAAPILGLRRNVGQNKHLRIAINGDSSVSKTDSVSLVRNQILRILGSL